ncbi:adenomatous polyposis coli protein [Plakobranchus ocellatus]|uniref:Adenomatous polyposis coli protein n=1 Tax=Plakobranchus ocellatus TaxID=259542 RepID=A0AAV4CGI3_9GAST|nr:adenomatous polyposis coli protein [Plakobranchus ocellatus]
MARSSYDELLKQVASLKTENCNLRKELKDNSSHLTKLENEASNMKDVLSHIQGTFDEPGEAGLADDMDEHGDLGKETGAEGYTGILLSTTSSISDEKRCRKKRRRQKSKQTTRQKQTVITKGPLRK